MQSPLPFPFLAACGLLLLVSSGCRTPDAPAVPAASKPVEMRFRDLILDDRRPAPLAPRTLSIREANGLRVERVEFTPELGERAVAVLMSPAQAGAARFPTVVLQHWLGGTKDSTPLVTVQQTLAQAGYLAVAIDARYRGERQRDGIDLQEAMIRAYRSGQGHPWLIDTAYDLIRLADVLVERPDADPKRLAIVGVSEGGFEAWMAAVADRRYSVIIPVIGVTRFTDMTAATGTDLGFDRAYRAVAKELGEPTVTHRVVESLWRRMLPGFDAEFDPVRLMPTLAPRPLLILAHEKDEIVPTEGAREVFAAVEAAYKAAGVPDRARLRVEPGLTHEDQTLAEWLDALAWLNQWLIPEEPS